MFIKRTIAILLLILLNNCGYSSIYSNTKNDNLKLNITSMSGDIDFNNQIKTYVNLYSNLNSENEYEIIINSNYRKDIIAKNSSGVATDYKVIASVNFIVKIDGKEKNISLEKI